ncbi:MULTISPECIES: hypothetical protein [Haloarcula]|uniref:hypothetical protein n=1 Tax=Haloarcula TaxID=2237 RepID=UPI0023ED8381|nr:hypothetical protein [Halomicroarcula sp. XH51]
MATSQVNFLVVAGHDIFLLHRLFIIILLAFFAKVLIRHHRITLNWLDLAVLSFLGIMIGRLILDIFQPYPLTQSVTIAIQIVLGVGLYFAIGSFNATRKELLVVFRVWLFTVIFVSLYGFYQVFALNLGLPFGALQLGGFKTKIAVLWGYPRPTSFFHEPTHYSAFVLPAYVFFTVVYYRGHGTVLMFKRDRMNSLFIGFIWLNYLLIVSLGGYLVIGALVGLGTLIDRQFRKIAVKLGIGVAVGVALIFVFAEGFAILYTPAYRIIKFARAVFGLLFFGGTVSGSIGVRLMRLYWSVLIWIEHPLFGLGLNNSIFLDLVPPDWCSRCSGKPPATHSVFGFVVTSTGSIGLVSYMLMYTAAGKYLYQAWQNFTNSFDRTLALGLALTLLTNVLINFFTLPIVHALNWVFLGLGSLVISLSYRD